MRNERGGAVAWVSSLIEASPLGRIAQRVLIAFVIGAGMYAGYLDLPQQFFIALAVISGALLTLLVLRRHYRRGAISP